MDMASTLGILVDTLVDTPL
jgi:uncharacterized protein YjbI with pentapeptide repeats